MRILSFVLLMVSCLWISAQTARIQIDTDGSVHPWNHLNVNNGAETFQFAIVTDRTGGHREGVFEDGVRKLNLLQPEFVMSVGDMIEGYTEDVAQIDREWNEFTGFISQLQMPFFYVPGNHDYINPVMAGKWRERFGKDYYHFIYKDVLFLALNSEAKMQGAGKGSIDDMQYEYVKKVLADNPNVRWTLLFMHQPLWTQNESGRWKDVETLLAPRKHTVFVGHNHRYVKYERNNGKYFILATTGGGSRLRGTSFGEFDHVVWVTMTNDGPIIANLLLDGIWDENVNTEDRFDLVRFLLEGHALRAEPLLMDKATFSQGNLKLRISNNSDVPMTALIRPESNEQLWASSGLIEKTVEPNTVEIVSIPVKTASPLASAAITPMNIEATLTYHPENQPVVQLDNHLLIRPEYPAAIPLARKEITIDGLSGDWKELRHSVAEKAYVQGSPFAHTGAADASFRFDFQYDANFLYMIAEVQDDQLEMRDANSPLNQDGLAFLIDARPLIESMNSEGEGFFKEYAVIAVSPGEKGDGEGNLLLRQMLPPGIKTYCRRTATGYVVEAAIPVAYLDLMQGGKWKQLRINVVQHDTDLGGQHESTLFWQPDWRTEENVMGSGVFRGE